MNIDIQVDGLDDKIAETVAAKVLQQLRAQIIEPLHLEKTTPSGQEEIMGLRPFDLYSVTFVAERWNVAKDTVRKLSDEELPRAAWHGGEIRYRGLDILRYEGVDVEHLLRSNTDAPRAESLGERTSRASASKSPKASRPYNQNLPEL